MTVIRSSVSPPAKPPMSAGLAQCANAALRERVHLGWWVFVLGGMGLLALLAFDARAYALWCAVATPALRQTHLRGLLIVALLGHLAEAIYAFRVAHRAGLQHEAVMWRVQTLAVGYPSLRLLVRRVGHKR